MLLLSGGMMWGGTGRDNSAYRTRCVTCDAYSQGSPNAHGWLAALWRLAYVSLRIALFCTVHHRSSSDETHHWTETSIHHLFVYYLFQNSWLNCFNSTPSGWDGYTLRSYSFQADTATNIFAVGFCKRHDFFVVKRQRLHFSVNCFLANH